MASGSGTITRAKWCGGGGNCIKIKHNSTYETVYAHMKSFAKGMKVGKKVRQGQIVKRKTFWGQSFGLLRVVFLTGLFCKNSGSVVVLFFFVCVRVTPIL